MKRIQKMLAVLVAMSMVFGMTTAVFAAGNAGIDTVMGTSDDTGTITIKGVSQQTTKQPVVKAYKIVEGQYSADGKNFLGYKVVDAYKNDISVDNDGGTYNFTEAELSNISKHLSGNGITMNAVAGKSGEYSAEVSVGSYLVIISNSEATVYNPMVVSVYYTNAQGSGNDLSQGIVDIQSTQNAWAKATTDPDLKKDIVSGDTTIKGGSVSVGDIVPYQIEINPIPYYGGNNPKLAVSDKLSAGLAFQNDVVVKVISANGSNVTLIPNTDYTLDATATNDKTFSVDFVVNGAYTLNKYVQQQRGTAKVVITYSAKLTGDAVSYNNVANTNEATLNFTRDSNTTGNDGTDEEKTYTYTFDIGGDLGGLLTEGFIDKIDGDSTSSNKIYLKDAEFTLYKDEDCTEVYKNEVFTGKTTTDQNGKFAIKGLEAGTYYLKETKAPDNYSLNDHVYPVVINASYETSGELKEATITIDGISGAFVKITQSGADTSSVKYIDIPNTKLSSLPSTGGIGTTIFTIGGCIIMIAAAGLFFASRRKSAK